MTREEINRIKYMVCCPLCDKERCERYADDCDVKRYMQGKAESEDRG
jgi:uncharacterized Fe-S cluster-containing protein